MGDITHSAKRVYRNSELELWLRRIMQDWEKPFRIEELEYGRILYKTSAIRTIELNRDEAIICARMDDGAEPYCVIDFDGDKFVYRGSDDCSLLTASLSVAGMYEIEELLGDILGADGVFELPDSVAKSSGDIDKLQAVTSPCDNVTAEHANDNTALDAGKSRVARNALVGVSNSGGSENLAPRELALTFTSRRKGLTFSAEWVLANGKTRKAFGDSCLPVESLTARECENLIRLASLARKSGFKYESELYTLLDISKIQTFLTLMLPKWREHFTIHKDRNVELLKAGERRVELMPKAKSVRGDSADFDVQWTPSVGGIEIDPTELSKLVGGVGSLRIIPQYGIVRVSNADTSFVREVERGREFGFKDGKIPRYMLLTLSDFGERINLSADLKKWMKSLTGQKCDAVLDLPPFLRKYQTRGVEWAIKLFNHDCNAMIADEMGLGKTLQTLSIIDFYLRKSGFDKNKKFLVVCPASVIPVWISESQKFFPLIKTDVLKSDGIDDSAQLIISSYTQLRRN